MSLHSDLFGLAVEDGEARAYLRSKGKSKSGPWLKGLEGCGVVSGTQVLRLRCASLRMAI